VTNSQLVEFTRISPNKNSPRSQPIRKITIHHTAGVIGIENLGAWFSNPACGGSSNYGVGSDGRVGMYVEERDRAWTSSSPQNDQQAVTIEVANSSTGGEWPVSDRAFAALIELCVDICKRNGIPELIYDGTPDGTLTRHNFFSNTNCPGKYLQDRFPLIAETVSKRLAAEPVTQAPLTPPKHWAEPSYEFLKASGIILHEQRFDDFMTRGEVFALLERVLKNR
jgi:hypothetical protein